MTEVHKTHQNLLVQVRQEKQTDYLESTSKKRKLSEGDIHVIIDMFPNEQKSNPQHDAGSETHVFTNTQLGLQKKRKTSNHCKSFTFSLMMNTRCNYRKHSRMTRLSSEWDSIISRTGMFWKQKNGTKTWSYPDKIRIKRNPNVQHSGRDPSNGLCTWNMARKSALISHKNLCTTPGAYSDNRHGFFRESLASNVFSLLMTTSKER